MPLRQPVDLRTRLHQVRARYPSTWAILCRKLQQPDAWHVLVEDYLDAEGRPMSADQAQSVKEAAAALQLWERNCSLAELLEVLQSRRLFDAEAFLRANLLNQTAPPQRPPSPPPPTPPAPPRPLALPHEANMPLEFSADHLLRAVTSGTSIGEGGFAEVYLTDALVDGQQHAVKAYHRGICNEARAAIFRSIGALSGMRHECIVRLVGYGYSPADERMFTVFPYYPNGDLRQLLNRFAEQDKWWSTAEAHASKFHLGGTRLRMATDIAAAIEFLHATEEKSMPQNGEAGPLAFRFVHKDVKPSNILVDSNWRCCLADLDFLDLTTSGSGQTIFDHQRAVTVVRVHTLGYSPPECRVTCKWDVFSAGVTILELLTGLRGEPASQDVPAESRLCRALATGRDGQTPTPPPPQPGLRLSAGLHARICWEALAPCLLDDYSQRCDAAVLLRRLQALQTTAEAEDRLGGDDAGLQEFNFGELERQVAGKEIGAGSFGCVYRASLPGSGQPAAVKRLLACSDLQARLLLESVHRQAKLRHPRLLRLLGFACSEMGDGQQLLLVYELCEGGNLRQLIDNFAAGQAPPACEFQLAGVRIRMAHELASAVDYLHSQQEEGLATAGQYRSYSLAHQDVKSTNVLLTADWHCKLGDLDTVQVATQGLGNTRLEERPQLPQPAVRYVTKGYYVPGEPDAPGERLSCKVDVYALGVTLLELFTGRRASGRGEPELRLSLMDAGQPAPPMQAGLLMSAGAYRDLCDSVLRPCLSLDPARRPTSAEVLRELDRFYSSCWPDPED